MPESDEVVVAEPSPDDVGEDRAAETLGQRLSSEDFTARAPFAGRVNLVAGGDGVLEVDAAAIDSANAVDESVTIATLANFARVAAGQLVATIKIIPYAVSAPVIESVSELLGQHVLRLHRRKHDNASLILSCSGGTSDAATKKGRTSVEERLKAFGIRLRSVETVYHVPDAIAGAVTRANGEMIFILGATATSDRRDSAPAGVARAGGRIIRFGMPVDPGNLLFLAEHCGRPVIGLPGCARSPVLNGADWVLERIACGIAVGSRDIASMGVGGLLKENSTRPQPRFGAPGGARAAHVTGILLAAGASTRMRGTDKLLEQADGVPLIARTARAMARSQLDAIVVVVPSGDCRRRSAVADLPVQVVEAPDIPAGMSDSLRAGLRAVPELSDAVLVALADMPDVSHDHVNRVVSAFSPDDGREICRAATADGKAGHPVLFGRRFFENLALLDGDRGARELLADALDFVVDVPTDGDGATVDLDTPEDWQAWRARQSGN